MVADILQAVEDLSLFSTVSKITSSQNDANVESVADYDNTSFAQSCTSCRRLTRSHYIAVLLLSWPYTDLESLAWGSRMRSAVDALLHLCDTRASELLKNEVQQLRRQLKSFWGFFNSCCRCQREHKQQINGRPVSAAESRD